MSTDPSSGITIRRGRMAADELGAHFTQIFNRALRDKRLSRRARGLLGELLTHQDGYGITIKKLVENGPEGRDAIANALKELEEYDYLYREREFDPSTRKLGGMAYHVTDMPDGFTVTGQSPKKNSRSISFEPEADFQGQDFQEQGNQSLECLIHKKTNERNPGGEHSDAAGAAAAPDGAESVPAKVVEQVCKALADGIKGRGVKRPKITYAWRDAARDLLTPDEDGFAYTVEEIEGGIAWAMQDSFWASRVPTMKKFAEHFGKIMMQARGEASDPKTNLGKQVQEDLTTRRIRRMDELEAELEAALGRQLNPVESQQLQARVQEEIQ